MFFRTVFPLAAALVALGSVARTGAAAATPDLGSGGACAECHRDIATSYAATAHARTSRAPSVEAILGSFAPRANILRTANPDLYFQMEARADGWFETGIVRASPTQALTRSERIDVVVGSGRKGQTYLYWDEEKLFQLPVSYWTRDGHWVNSPGYIDGTADFERPIFGRCLECHATSFRSGLSAPNSYARNSLELGISCEKCHGPGAAHIAAMRRDKTVATATRETAIVNPARLARERQVDVCSLCHAGPGEALTPPLSFRPGDKLASHLVFPPLPPDAHVDVHASQVQLMERSRCFQASGTMTCSTCHNVHRPERDITALAARCLGCHQVEACRLFPREGRKISDQCVSCHMPLETTAQIVIAGESAGGLETKVRNHRIAIYRPNAAP